ncbi:MAG: hypothetical protein C4575_10495 [Desulforudis sp.]|jgi:gluconate kinase|nr:MAG: hypothetical protein C4575_10495 [Desulforudis sp.]
MHKKFFVIRKRPRLFCDDIIDYRCITGFVFLRSDYSHLVRRAWREEMRKAIEEGDEERIKYLEKIKSKMGIHSGAYHMFIMSCSGVG